MTILPIVARELNVMARRAGVRWVRVAVAALASFFCFQSFEANSSIGISNTAGQAVLRALSAAGFLFACAAAFQAAESVNVERREGTLGLLFLTDLKSHDVVLGKLISAGANSFYSLAGFAPVLMLPLVVGGVTVSEVTRTALGLLGVMSVSLSVGLLVAARVAGRIQTMSITGLALIAFLLAPWIPKLLWPGANIFYVEILSPACAFFGARKAVGGVIFWSSLVCAVCEAVLVLAIASRTLLSHWRDASKVERARSGHEKRRSARAGDDASIGESSVTARYGSRAFAPVAYAVLRRQGSGVQTWVAASLAVVASLLSAPGATRVGISMVWAGASAALWFGAAGIFSWMAGRFFFEGRRSGELELLLPTPLGASGIIRDQWLALRRLLHGPLLLVAFGTVPYAAVMVVGFRGRELTGLLASILYLTNLILSVVAVCSVGMWFGLHAKRPLAVAAWSAGIVEIGPTIFAYFVALLATAAIQVNGASDGSAMAVWGVFLPLFLIGKNLFFIWWAHQRLRAEFRTTNSRHTRTFFGGAVGDSREQPDGSMPPKLALHPPQ